MKTSTKLLVHCSLFIVSFFAITGVVLAANDYTLLAPSVPFIGKTYTPGNLAGYLQGIFRLGIGIAVTLAILILVKNGIQWMVSDVAGKKEEVKDWSWDAILGLLLAFSAWLILSTINPDLVKFKLVQTIKDAKEQALRPPVGGTVTTVGKPWPDDSKERGLLDAGGVHVKTPTCKTDVQKGCTSVAGLSQTSISKLIQLKAKCKCEVFISGGTEYWLHKTHGGNNTVDIRNYADLAAYLGGMGEKCGDTKPKDGLTFHWEDKSCPWATAGDGHWHVPL
ncbi:MAG: pilin [Patescibacteria group bacterium]